jgi:hypothetical protein
MNFKMTVCRLGTIRSFAQVPPSDTGYWIKDILSECKWGFINARSLLCITSFRFGEIIDAAMTIGSGQSTWP